MPVNPDFYHVIASVAREDGHAYRGHVLGDKPKDASYGYSEFNCTDGSYGKEISIDSGNELAHFILAMVNNPKTQGFYNTKNNSTTLVSTDHNVLIIFNNSPRYGDAGTIFRPFNKDSSFNITANKYREKLHLAQAMDGDGIVLEAQGPDDIRAFVQMFADNTDFSIKPTRAVINAQQLNNELVSNPNRLSTLDFMEDQRDIVVALKASDLRNDKITEPPEVGVPDVESRIRNIEARLLEKKNALANQQRVAQVEHSKAKKLNDKIISAVKQGAEITDMEDGSVFVSVTVDGKDVDYEIIMAADGKSAELIIDGMPESHATLTTASRLNALKSQITQKERELLKKPEWAYKADGKPLSWVKKSGTVLLLATMASIGSGVRDQGNASDLYTAYDRVEPSSVNFNYVAKPYEEGDGVYKIVTIKNDDDADPKITDELIV